MTHGKQYIMIMLSVIIISCSHDNTELYADAHDYRDHATEIDIIRSYDEARQLAERSISIIESGQNTRAKLARRIISSETAVTHITRAGEETPIFYIFNFDDEAGFSVISARKDISPIIAVTEQGNYTYGQPTGVEPFDEYMQLAENAIIEIGKPLRPLPVDSLMVKTQTEDIERHCDPLLQTRWGQHEIFGMYCPNKVAGCGTTAMAQIMSYHKFPQTITTTYEDAPYAGQAVNIPWDKVIPHVAYSSTCVNVLDCISNHYTVGALLREIGERVNMNYDVIKNQSGCSIYNIPDGFRDLGYYSGELTPIDTARIFSNLDTQKPLIATGLTPNSNSGHVWVIDGYKYSRHIVRGEKPWVVTKDGETKIEYVWETIIDDESILIHHNWGHNGKCNGYFNYGIYQQNQGIEYDNKENYSSGNYSHNVQIIPNITPANL